MGVAGSGKSTIGRALAERLEVDFLDADDLHAADAVAKMASGIPLEDVDRWPWLDRVAAAIHGASGPIVVACSALRRDYRDHIRSSSGRAIVVVQLDGAPALLAARLAARTGHFLPPSLLESQLETLELLADDEAGFAVSILSSPAAVVDEIASRLRKLEPGRS
jgi:carbohydrate kinase (thermoresistant glucokinase family)